MTALVTQYVLFFFYYFTEQIHIIINLYCLLQLSSFRWIWRGRENQAGYQRGRGCWHFAELDVGRRPSSSPWRGGRGAFGRGKFIPLLLSCCLPLSISYLLPILPSQSWHWIVIGYFLLLFRGWDCSTRLVKSGRRHGNWKQRHSSWKQRGGESSGRL